MCCRFYISEDQGIPDVQTGEIFPSNLVPVFANSKALTVKPFAMKWGYNLGGKLLINARSETAMQKEIFSDGMKNHRCLIPLSCYYEWEQRDKQKIKYAIRSAKEKSSLAGIYRLEAGKPVFTVLTREPADNIRFIHNRMPVILPQGADSEWLNLRCSAEDILKEAVLDIEYKEAESVQERMF